MHPQHYFSSVQNFKITNKKVYILKWNISGDTGLYSPIDFKNPSEQGEPS